MILFSLTGIIHYFYQTRVRSLQVFIFNRIPLTAAPGPRSTREKLAPATTSRCYVANFPCIYLYPHTTTPLPPGPGPLGKKRPRNCPQFLFLSYSVFVFVFSHGFVILFDRMSKKWVLPIEHLQILLVVEEKYFWFSWQIQLFRWFSIARKVRCLRSNWGLRGILGLEN